MSDDTLTALSQRPEAFWIALALLAVGSLLPETGVGPDTLVDDTMIGLAALILVTRVGVALYRIVGHSVVAGRSGYDEGKSND